MTRPRPRGYAALISVATLASVLLAASALLNARVSSAQRGAQSRFAAAQARLAAEGALLRAVHGLARDGRAWQPASDSGIAVTAQPDGALRVRARGAAGLAQTSLAALVTCDDTRPSGARVVAVRRTP